VQSDGMNVQHGIQSPIESKSIPKCHQDAQDTADAKSISDLSRCDASVSNTRNSFADAALLIIATNATTLSHVVDALSHTQLERTLAPPYPAISVATPVAPQPLSV